ncbi:AAA family ATPase [Aeromicrobium sp.]|nr:AAA family ATPase [Candidatus Saccharibacteria bacterium]
MRQAQALQVLLSGESAFLTGAPGAGKTYVLNQFIRRATRLGKTVAVTASTGIAATHIGGTTIHSWSGLGIRDSLSDWDKDWLKSNARLKKRYNATDTLVIDEISMLHGARLDMVSEACKILRENDEPFGGLQVVLVGDLFQLPPVTRGSEMLDFAHTSAAWHELSPKVCYITEQHRQAGDELLDLLEAMRAGQLEDNHVESLQDRLGRKPNIGEPVTRLYAHNIDVETINTKHLAAIASDTKSFTMQTKGTAAKVEQLVKSVLAPERLELKIGAEVMFVANNFATGFVNGSRGRVTGFYDGLPMVELLSNGKSIKVETHSWALVEDDRKRAEVSQLPLRLAWAITIHKSQGMSLDAAEIDLSKSFTPGMGYVALSRVRSLKGVYLTGVNAMALQLHPDIYEFDRKLQSASHHLAETTDDAPEEVVPDRPEQNEEGEASEDVPVSYDEVLFDTLRHWRLDRARVEKVAPFMIAHDSTLQELARRKPLTPQKLLAMKGFGPKKAENYGDDILDLIAIHNEDQLKHGTTEPGLETGGEVDITKAKRSVVSATNIPTAQSGHNDSSAGWTLAENAELLKHFRDGTPLPKVATLFHATHQEIWAHLAEIIRD